MALQTLDPLALSATKLQAGGMDAQEVAYKRKAMEDDLAKTQLAVAAKDRETAQKQKEADQKAFPALSETVALPYTQAWTQRMSNEEKTLAKELLDYRQGIGSNPNDPLSEAGMRRAARNASHKQYAANTNSWFKITNDLADDIRKNPGSYKDGALQEVLDAQRDITVAEKGEYPDLTKRLFDLQKHTDTILGYVKESGSGKAVTMPDGSIKTTSSEYILPADVKAGIKTALLKPEARDEALRWFSEMPKEDQDAVMEFAKNNQMSPEEAMIYNVEMPIYSYTKYKETLNAPSEGAAGRIDEAKVASEFVRAVENVTKGTHQGFSRIVEAFPGMTAGQVSTLVSKNPVLKAAFDVDPTSGEIVAKPGYEIVKDFNRLTVDVKPEVKKIGGGSPEKPIKIQAAVRAPNGNISVLTGTDDDFKAGTLKASPPIPKEDVFQKIVYPALWNGGEYNPVTPAGMQRAMEEMGYDVKTETMNQWNKKFVYEDPNASQGAVQQPAQGAAVTKRKAY